MRVGPCVYTHTIHAHIHTQSHIMRLELIHYRSLSCSNAVQYFVVIHIKRFKGERSEPFLARLPPTSPSKENCLLCGCGDTSPINSVNVICHVVDVVLGVETSVIPGTLHVASFEFDTCEFLFQKMNAYAHL